MYKKHKPKKSGKTAPLKEKSRKHQKGEIKRKVYFWVI